MGSKSIQVKRVGNVTICSGPVDTGKTTYAREVIAEALGNKDKVCVIDGGREYDDLRDEVVVVHKVDAEQLRSTNARLCVVDEIDKLGSESVQSVIDAVGELECEIMVVCFDSPRLNLEELQK